MSNNYYILNSPVRTIITNFETISGEKERIERSLKTRNDAIIIDESAKAGWVYVFNLAALLSINLGVINILPIPALDGCKLVFLLYEALRGKPVAPEKEGMLNMIGFMLLMGLIVVVTYKDIMRLFF